MNRVRTRRRILTASDRRKAFALKELIATGALLAIWSVWLIPTAAGVRHSSKQDRCLANLMRVGFANTVYAANDPSDMAIPVNWRQFCQCPGQDCGTPCEEPLYIGAYEWGGKSGVGETGDPHAVEVGAPSTGELAWMSSKFGTAAGAGPARRPLNAILYKQPFEDHRGNRQFWGHDTELDLDVYRCPSDTGYTGIHHPGFANDRRTSFDYYGTSYNANVFMVTNQGGGSMLSNSPYLHRMSELLSPATTLAFMENNGRFAWAAEPELDECSWNSSGFAGTVRGWHGKDWTFNAAFLDGHAGTIYMRGYRNPQVFRPDDNRQENFRCVVIRGEGWQMDTLPVGLVDSRVFHGGTGRASYENGIR